MGSLERFKIDLNGLKGGLSVFDFHLDDAYFEAIDAPDIRRGELTVKLGINRRDSYFDLDFHTAGTIQIPCDLCLDDMDWAVNTDNKLVVKFGDEYLEEDDLVTVRADEGMLDLSWFIYEFIALTIPIRHAHAEGQCNPTMSKILREYSATQNSDKAMDSRWSELEKLKTIIKD